MIQKQFEHSSWNFRKENYTCEQSRAWEAFTEYASSVKELGGKTRIFDATNKTTFLIIQVPKRTCRQQHPKGPSRDGTVCIQSGLESYVKSG